MGAAVHTSIDTADDTADPPPSSVAPASVPRGFAIGVVASLAGLRDSHGDTPLDFCVPVPSSTDLPPDLGSRAILVLTFVDGERSIGDIASRAGLALPDAIETVLELAGMGALAVSPDPSGSAGALAEAERRS
jgi:hypothetical protein